MIFFMLASFRLDASDDNLCVGPSQNCPTDEVDDASFLQTNVHSSFKGQTVKPGAESLLEMTQRIHKEMEAKKMEFFSTAIRGLPISKKAIAAHDDFRDKFLANYPRDYDRLDVKAIPEYASRLENFAKFQDLIEARNANEKANNTHPNAAVHGITKYADWTEDEFNALLGRKPPIASASNATNATNLNQKSAKRSVAVAPCTQEWSKRTSMRNQGNCGSCWTFATATTLRASYIQQHGVDPGKLSTQYLVDCINRETCGDGVNGCCGGNPAYAYEWIMKAGGIPTQEAYGDFYPPDADSLLEMSAVSNKTKTKGGPISNSHGITFSGNHPKTSYPCKSGIKNAVTLTAVPEKKTTESDMADYVCKTGVLGISVDASQWNTYKSGVLSAATCASQTDHAVTLIGIDAKENAWIVQNQWGADWGVSLTGAPPPASKWSNCPELAQGNGCHDPYNAWIATDCALECSGNVADGGYVYLKFGENTCGVTDEALAPLETVAATGVTGGIKTTTTTTTYDAWLWGYKSGYDDGKDGKATTTSNEPPSDQNYAWGYSAGYQDGEAGNEYLGR